MSSDIYICGSVTSDIYICGIVEMCFAVTSDINIGSDVEKCYEMVGEEEHIFNLVEKQTGFDGYPNRQFASL